MKRWQSNEPIRVSNVVLGRACIRWAAVVAAAVLYVLFPPSPGARAAPKFTTIHSFTPGNPNGSWPSGELIVDQNDVIYGTTERGGSACPTALGSCGGTVYTLTPPASPGGTWRHRVLTTFRGGTDGATPRAGVIIRPGADPFIHGTTVYGGRPSCTHETRGWGCGTVFQLVPPQPDKPGWTKRILYRFGAENDGRFPESRFLQLRDGTLLGATAQGGRLGGGSAFSLTPESALDATADSSVPSEASGGITPAFLELYFMTELRQAGWKPFAPSFGHYLDSFWDRHLAKYYDGPPLPTGQSVPRAEEPLQVFGLAMRGGSDECVDSHLGCGTIFQLTEPPSGETDWGRKLLHRFQGGSGGSFPTSTGVFGPDGALYGTANGGLGCPNEPVPGCGMVYRLIPPDGIGSRWRYQVLYRFRGGQDGAVPEGRIAVDRDRNVFGVTKRGGGCAALTDGCGAIYKLVPPTPPQTKWTRVILHRFQTAFDSPPSGILLHRGALYGLTQHTAYRLKL